MSRQRRVLDSNGRADSTFALSLFSCFLPASYSFAAASSTRSSLGLHLLELPLVSSHLEGVLTEAAFVARGKLSGLIVFLLFFLSNLQSFSSCRCKSTSPPLDTPFSTSTGKLQIPERTFFPSSSTRSRWILSPPLTPRTEAESLLGFHYLFEDHQVLWMGAALARESR